MWSGSSRNGLRFGFGPCGWGCGLDTVGGVVPMVMSGSIIPFRLLVSVI